MQLIENNFAATPEEKYEIEAALLKDSNPFKHNVHMFRYNKDLLKKQADMNGNVTYVVNNFIQKTYKAVKNITSGSLTNTVSNRIKNHRISAIQKLYVAYTSWNDMTNLMHNVIGYMASV